MGFKWILIGSVCGYAFFTTAMVKFCSTSLTWKERFREKFPYPLTVIAHRGGSAVAPENTLYAFEVALKNGNANALELDVWRSKDGKLVVSHDDSLERTCGEAYCQVLISELTVGDFPDQSLPQTLRCIPLSFPTTEHREYKAAQDVPIDQRTRICLLSELFKRFPGVVMHIDIKAIGLNVVYDVFNMIREFHRESITIVGSSECLNKQHIKRYFLENSHVRPKFRIFANAKDFLKVYALFYTGVLPFVNLDFDVFSIPIFTTNMRKYAQKSHGSVLATLILFFITSPTLWLHLQQRGIAVLGWVVNDREDFTDAIKWPINGIMTDDPAYLRRFLEDKGTGIMNFTA